MLSNNDNQDICNFWNQRNQKYFNKRLAKDLLIWIMKSELPRNYSEEEVIVLLTPLINLLKNEYNKECLVSDDTVSIFEKKYRIIPAFNKAFEDSVSDFEIMYSLPVLINKIISNP